MTARPTRNQLDLATMDQAIEQASVACLLPVLFQLSGDDRWLSERYRPRPTPGFDEDPSGGLDDATATEVRNAAQSVLRSWASGTPVSVPAPTHDELARMMTTCLGEPVPAEFGPMVAQQAGITPFQPADLRDEIAARPGGFNALIIGAGISGIIAAIQLDRAGVPYTILEKNEGLGGTWFENRYPGARCDIPSHLYSFSFAPARWTEHFAQQEEIEAYLRGVVADHGVRERVEFQQEVTAAHWEEATGRWQVRTRTPGGQEQTREATILITAVGIHNRPSIPDIEGLESFGGQVVHSARWHPDVAIDGRRVGVVGAGATAMQVVTATAPRAETLTVFQRSPQWMIPNPQYFEPMPDWKSWLFEHVPFYRGWYRFRLYWLYTERLYNALLVDPDAPEGVANRFNEAYRRFLRTYLETELEGRPDLIAASIPDHPPLGKRLLMDNGWYRTLRRDNVSLVTGGIASIDATGVWTADGDHHELDTLVLCTGFKQQQFLFPLEIVGRDGRDLRTEWRDDDARAYLGMMTPGYPNLFFLYGPNSNPTAGSYITVAEAQVQFVVEMVRRMVNDRALSVEPGQEVFEQYNKELDALNDRMVYALPGLQNYYRNASGRVVTNNPWPVLEYWSRLTSPHVDQFTWRLADEHVGSG